MKHAKVLLLLGVCVALCGLGSAQQEPKEETESVVLAVEPVSSGDGEIQLVDAASPVDAGETQQADAEAAAGTRKVRQFFGPPPPPFFVPPAAAYYGGGFGGFGGGYGGFGGGYQRTRVVTRTRYRGGGGYGGFGGFGGGYYG